MADLLTRKADKEKKTFKAKEENEDRNEKSPHVCVRKTIHWPN